VKPNILGALLLFAMSGSSVGALGVGAKVKGVHVVPKANEVRIEVELTAPVTPIVRELGNPSRMIIDLPNSSVGDQSHLLKLYRSGVYEIHVGARASNPSNARIVVGIDSARPYAIKTLGSTFVLSILPLPANAVPVATTNLRTVAASKVTEDVNTDVATASMSPVPKVKTSGFSPSTFGVGAKVKSVHVKANGNEVGIEVELTTPVTPIIRELRNPSRLIMDLPKSSVGDQSERLKLYRSGVYEIHVGANTGNPSNTRIVVGIDSARPYAIQALGNTVVLSILPHPATAAVSVAATDLTKNLPAVAEDVNAVAAPASNSRMPQVETIPLESAIDEPETKLAYSVRQSFKIKYIAGDTVYLDGGANSGVRIGMELDINRPHSVATGATPANSQDVFVASIRVIGIAAASAVTELVTEDHAIRVGDVAELTPKDAAAAAGNALSATRGERGNVALGANQDTDSSSAAEPAESNFVRSPRVKETVESPGMAGRITFDSSAITSFGSTPGTTIQNGVSVQSDMTGILGTHWNLQGYWRGRINRHSQFQEPTIEESLNKTYTMQLYYDNPNAKWVAGIGRLYLPWAVSLDTIDGGYLGRKSALGMTTGVFLGSTPDLNSWHYRPNQRIGGSFINFTGGNYDGVHYSSTSGVGVNTIGWKIDRPFAFFENEVSYKGVLSVDHSLIADTLRGVSTNGLRIGPGVSHSYFTAHYKPFQAVSVDLYHNYFRDVPTATTTIVGTGLVDQLLFQGISGGVHLKPTRDVILYATLGASEKTGDSHRSLNQVYGASWSEIARTGLRADFHYSKFDSNFGKGNYQVLSLSRQVTNRAFWNLQIGKQDLLSQFTTNHDSKYITDSIDFNFGRRSYLQSGYTYVNGATLNYREWYFSWGLRLGKVNSKPEYAQSVGPVR